MSGTASFRGQPLLVLAALLGAWLAGRVMLWQPSFDTALVAAPHAAEAASGRPLATAGEHLALLSDGGSARFVATQGPAPGTAGRALRAVLSPRPFNPAVAALASPAATRVDPVRAAIGHSLLLAAGLSQMELPPLLAAYLHGGSPPGPGVPAAAPALAALSQHAPPYTGPRLSADAWLMVRQDTTSPVVSGRPSYGRSQAGAVVRYRLAPASRHAPQAYLRASSALAGALEKDLVVGLSGRLLSTVPLRFAVEARISETGAGTELRPAVIAVTEFPPLDLPLGLRGEAYVQAGYVGGRFATAFVDGQARIARPVARVGAAEVTAGAGAWGGAQEGAARLDIGPTAAASFRLGDARGRVAADYRFRVAGEAEPKSGPALTLSAGF